MQMGGGCWDHLWSKGLDEFLARYGAERNPVVLLELMAERLDREGAPDAATETREYARRLVEFQRQVEGAGDPPEWLRDIWHAVERVDSGDRAEDAIGRAVARWRAERATERHLGAVRERLRPAVESLSRLVIASVNAIARRDLGTMLDAATAAESAATALRVAIEDIILEHEGAT